MRTKLGYAAGVVILVAATTISAVPGGGTI